MKIEEMVRGAIARKLIVEKKRAQEQAEKDATRLRAALDYNQSKAREVLGAEIYGQFYTKLESGCLWFEVEGVEFSISAWGTQALRVECEILASSHSTGWMPVYAQDNNDLAPPEQFLRAVVELLPQAQERLRAKHQADVELKADIAAGRRDEEGEIIIPAKAPVDGPWRVVHDIQYRLLQDVLNEIGGLGYEVYAILHDPGHDGYNGSPIVIARKGAVRLWQDLKSPAAREETTA